MKSINEIYREYLEQLKNEGISNLLATEAFLDVLSEHLDESEENREFYDFLLDLESKNRFTRQEILAERQNENYDRAKHIADTYINSPKAITKTFWIFREPTFMELADMARRIEESRSGMVNAWDAPYIFNICSGITGEVYACSDEYGLWEINE